MNVAVGLRSEEADRREELEAAARIIGHSLETELDEVLPAIVAEVFLVGHIKKGHEKGDGSSRPHCFEKTSADVLLLQYSARVLRCWLSDR